MGELMQYNYRRREGAPYTDMSDDKPIPTSPDRHTFLQEQHLQRRQDAGEPVDDEFLSILDEIRHSHRRRFDDPAQRENNMEWDLLTADWLVAKVRASERYAQNLYAALCNREFIRNEVWQQLKGEPRWRCSWRYAGGIIADLREEGDYMDWYCSGIRHDDGAEQDQDINEGTVTDEVREDLLKLGWVVLDDE